MMTHSGTETELINETFYRLITIHTGWKAAVDQTQENAIQAFKDSYRRELKTAMIEMEINSDLMIQNGINKSMKSGSAFLPNPGDFCRSCLPTPEDYGMPSPFDAFQEAMKKAGQHQSMRDTWSHNAVYLAAANTGFYELKKTGESDQRYRDIKKAFEAHYKRSSDKVIRGGILSVPPEHRVEVQKPIVTASSKSIGDSALNKLMGMFE